MLLLLVICFALTHSFNYLHLPLQFKHFSVLCLPLCKKFLPFGGHLFPNSLTFILNSVLYFLSLLVLLKREQCKTETQSNNRIKVTSTHTKYLQVFFEILHYIGYNIHTCTNNYNYSTNIIIITGLNCPDATHAYQLGGGLETCVRIHCFSFSGSRTSMGRNTHHLAVSSISMYVCFFVYTCVYTPVHRCTQTFPVCDSFC